MKCAFNPYPEITTTEAGLDAKQAALVEFLSETEEMLERISINLQKIEGGSSRDENINELYRDIHSIKGSAHLFGCSQMGQLAHALESSLDPVRNKNAPMNSDFVDAVYEGIDILSAIAVAVRKEHAEPDFSCKLARIIPKITEVTTSILSGELPVNKDVAIDFGDQAERSYVEGSRQVDLKGKHAADTKPPAPGENPTPVNNSVSKKTGAKMEDSILASNDNTSHPQQPRENLVDQSREGKQPETLRVQVGILDKLMNLVGELVLIRNQHLQFGNSHNDPELGALNQRLNIVTGELQEEIMKTRMQPIGTVLTKFHRVVRDLAKDLGKQINLTMEGAETELDKTLLEAVKDPLMHIIRNAVDHGIESPKERIESGKAAVGTVKIRAFHEGGQVIVEIEDNGRGLSRETISRKVLEKGLCTTEKLERLNDRDLFLFIFSPGFSTADKVSNVSGRGVGMDVVRTNIERIGGMVDLSSVENSGTVVRLKIPLTLAIIPALIVRSGGERFAIPQVKLVELVRLNKDSQGVTKGVEFLQGKPVYRLRGQLLPLVCLNDTLGLRNQFAVTTSENIVVLNADTGIFGLVVDEIEDSNDIVVKPLMQFLKDLSVYSGATVLGDGSIALTLDVIGLANTLGIFTTIENDVNQSLGSNTTSAGLDNADYLLVNVGAPGRYGIPLCVVNRLEEFSRDQIEVSGEQRVIRYRDSLLPIVSVTDHLNLPFPKESETTSGSCSIVVIQKNNRLFGLEFNNIIDIVNAYSNLNTDLRDRNGILGNLLLEEEVIVLVDVYKIVDSVFEVDKASFGDAGSRGNRNERTRKKILLVEDNAFFRKQVAQLLSAAGFKVVTAVNGEEGIRTLKSDVNGISAVLSDIEMPIMDGFTMASEIKKDAQTRHVPLVALTTRYRKADLERGKEVGFQEYLEKLNPDILIPKLDMVLNVGESL